MFSILDDMTIKTEAALREDEIQRMLKEREARRPARRHDSRTWRWQVEPGKAAEFEHLRGWLLSGLPEALGESPAFDQKRSTRVTDRVHIVPPGRSHARRAQEHVTTFRRLSPVRLGARLAGRAAMRAGRRLLQWGNAADETETSAA